MKHALLIDGQAIVRYGTTILLQEHFPGILVSATEDISKMMAYLDEVKFDLLILDIDILERQDSAVLDIIALKQPGIKILMFSGYNERLYAQRYLDAGVHGFLSKSESERKLKQAISIILQGGIYVSEEFRNYLRES